MQHLHRITCMGAATLKLAGAGTWTMTLAPGAPDDNTYDIVNALRPDATATCFGNLSCVGCPGNGIDQYGLVSTCILLSHK